MDVSQISGIGAYAERKHGEKGEDRVFEVFAAGSGAVPDVALDVVPVPDAVPVPDVAHGQGKAFLVMRPKTIEVRCDAKLSKVLREKYETVMESRYFGRGGVEIVPSGQLSEEELEDLVRLSYNLTRELVEQ